MWSALFFFMLICLGLSSIAAGAQTIVAFVLDERPKWAKNRTWIIVAIVVSSVVLGLPFVWEVSSWV